MKPLVAFFMCVVVGVGLALVQEHAPKRVYRITLALSVVVVMAAGWYFF